MGPVSPMKFTVMRAATSPAQSIDSIWLGGNASGVVDAKAHDLACAAEA